MKNHLLSLAFVLMVGSAYAQSKLPACPSSGNFHNCFGIKTFPNGDKYVGEFKDGRRNGQGTLSAPNGLEYVGEFKNDMFNGQGTLFAPNGAVITQGIFVDNKSVP
jgi:hypothetical protein